MSTAYYDDLSPHNQIAFRQALRRLLYEGSLQESLPSDRDDYLVLSEYHELASAILGLFDTRLILDDRYQVAYFEPLQGPEGLARLGTVDALALLVVLRQELELGRQAGKETATILIHDLEEKFRVQRGRAFSKTNFRQALGELRRLKFVTNTSALDKGDTMLTILPLTLSLTPERMDAMTERLLRSSEE